MATLLAASAEGLTAASREAYGGALPFVSLLLLFALLFERQVMTGLGSSGAVRRVSVLDVAIAPLAMAAAVIIVVRLLSVLM
jgi:hypothetical protein